MRILFIKLLLLTITCSHNFYEAKSADYYWVGGSGNWSDLNHWATTPGGTVRYLQVPTPNDNVFFDAASFTAPGQTVAVNVSNAVCRNMSWAGALHNPVFTGTSAFRIYGSLTLTKPMQWQYTAPLWFEATNTGNTITTAGNRLQSDAIFNGIGGEWILQDSLGVLSGITVNNGHFNTNNQIVSCDYFSSTNNAARTLTITDSEIRCASWNASGASLTLNAQGSTIRVNGTFNHDGTGKAYHNLVFENNAYYYNASWTSQRCSYNVVTALGVLGNYGGSGNRSDSILLHQGMTPNGMGFRQDTANYLLINGNGLLAHSNRFGTARLLGNTKITGSSGYDTLAFAAGNIYTLNSNSTQTLYHDWIAEGNCNSTITIESSSATARANVSKTGGTIIINYVSLKGINAAGGATFTANSSVNVGNNAGWTINNPAPLQLFWVGGTGNWNDASHWSFTSGGTGGACLPTPNDDVRFDANSFTAPGQTVTVNVGNGVCRNMSWAGALHNPVFTGTNAFRIYGSLTLTKPMQWQYTAPLWFEATNTGNTITTAGNRLQSDAIFNGIGGEWILQDSLGVLSGITVNNGHFNTNNQIVSCDYFSSTNNAARTLTITDSEIRCASWNASGASLTLNAQGSTIRVNGTFNHDGTGKAYHNLVFENNAYYYNASWTSQRCSYNVVTALGVLGNYGGSGNRSDSILLHQGMTPNGMGFRQDTANYLLINGNGLLAHSNRFGTARLLGNTKITGSSGYDTLAFAAGNIYTLNSNSTQTLYHDWIAEGNCNSTITIESSSATARANVSKTGGTIIINYVSLKGINTTGGATFTANNVADLGNNAGWAITGVTARQLYWVGGSGNWADAAHWSTTSGGPGGTCIPTALDNVFFDGASFASPGQVTVNVNNAVCRNMSWAGALHNPVFTGTNAFRIYGSLTLTKPMQWQYTAPLWFEATTTGNTITTAGNRLQSDAIFNGIDGEWILQDSLGVLSGITVNNGHFNTNNQIVSCDYFSSTNNAARTLTITDSEIRCASWNASGASLTLNAQGSTIRVNSTFSHDGTGKAYHNLVFENNSYYHNASWTSQRCSYNVVTVLGALGNYGGSGNRSDSILLHQGMTPYGMGFRQDTANYLLVNGNGLLAHSNRFGKAKLFGNTEINGNNVYDTLILAPGNIYTLRASATQRVNDSLSMRGNGCFPITVRSSSPTVQSIISKPNGTVTADFVEMHNQMATGGASFYAGSYSTNVTNNTGWNFNNGPGYNYGLGPDISFCGGGGRTVTLNTDNFNGGTAWLWSNGATTPTITTTQGGQYWVRVIFGNTCFFSDTLNINAIIVPPVAAGSNSPVCEGSTIVLNASGATNYQWSGPGGFSSTLSSPVIGNAAGVHQGVYTVTTTANGCTSDPTTVPVMITNGALPAISIQTNSATICQGGAAIFTAIAGNAGNAPVYQWQVNGVNAGSNNPVFTTNALVNGDAVRCLLSTTGTCGNGQQLSNEITMLVTPAVTPIVSIATTSTTACNNDPVSFTATAVHGGSSPSFQWQVNGSPAGTNQSQFTATNLNNGDVIACTLNSNASCVTTPVAVSNNVTIAIQNAVVPALSISTPETTICTGSSISFTALPANGGSNPVFQWLVNGVNAGSNQPVFTTSSLNSGDVVSCILTTSLSCASTSSATSNAITISTNASLTASVQVLVPQTEVCSGSSLSFSAHAVNGGSLPLYQWQVNGINAGTGTPVFTTSTLSNGDVVRCILTSNSSCVTTATVVSNEFTITVNTLVTAGITINANAHTICLGEHATFNATAVHGGPTPSYQWRVNGVNTGSNLPQFSSSTLQDGDVVTCVLTSNAGCVVAANVVSNSVAMQVTPLQSVTVAVTAMHTSICEGSNASFTAAASNGGSTPVYQWMVNGINTGTNDQVFNSTTLKNGDQITCTITSNASCVTNTTATSNVVVMNVQEPQEVTVSIAADNNPICSGDLVSFIATPGDAGITPVFQWLVNGQAAGGNSPQFSSNILMENDTVQCIITSSAQCSQTSTAASNKIAIKLGTPLNPPQLSATHISESVAEFTWQPVAGAMAYRVSVNGGSFVTPSSGVAGSSHRVTGLQAGQSTTVSVQVLGSLPCETNVSGPVAIVAPASTIPNVFSPNGDGINDRWIIHKLVAYPRCSVEVFNRYGQRVFTSVGYLQPWDGSSNGKPLSPGTYYYIIDLKNGSKIAGWVTIIR